MAKVVDLDDLVPEDIIFKIHGEEFPIPGDIDVEYVFKLLKHFQGLVDIGENVEEQERALLSVRGELLELFKIKRPELESLPFGLVAMQHVLRTILEQLGLAFGDGAQPTLMEPEDESVPPPKPSRSRRSTG